MEALLAVVIQFWAAPLLALGVSIAYFFASPSSQSVPVRLLASSHGAAIALVYVGALIVSTAGIAKPGLAVPFLLALGVPVLLALLSFFVFRGRPLTHALQLVNVACLAWAFFIGTMAITGEWL
jgi:hypothetical protein